MSQSLLYNLLHGGLHTTELYSSDYKLLFIQVLKDAIFGNPTRAALKQSNISRTIFLYDTIKPILWDMFATHTNTKALDLLGGLVVNTLSLNNITDINCTWNTIRSGIM